MGTRPRPVANRGSARARFLALVAVLAVAGAVACQPVKKAAPPPPPPPPPALPTQYCAPATPTNASQYQAAFDGLFATNTAGWIASDGGLPVLLPGGRILWMFGDTYIGRLGAGTNGAASFEQLANNGFVVQTGRCFRPTREPIPDPPGGHWIWPTGAVIQGNLLRVFGLHMRKSTDPPPFDFTLVSIEVATFSLDGLVLQSVTALPLPSSPRRYGESVLVDGGFVYAYGQERSDPPNPNSFPIPRHYVARAPLGSNLLSQQSWWFWSGDPSLGDGGWVNNNPTAAGPMLFDTGSGPNPTSGPLAGFPVARTGYGYLGSAFNIDAFSNDYIWTWDGVAPQGPWIRRAIPAVDIRQTHGQLQYPERLAYGGRVVFGVPNGPIALWSVNRDSFDAILADPRLYKVWFRTPSSASIAPPTP